MSERESRCCWTVRTQLERDRAEVGRLTRALLDKPDVARLRGKLTKAQGQLEHMRRQWADHQAEHQAGHREHQEQMGTVRCSATRLTGGRCLRQSGESAKEPWYCAVHQKEKARGK